MIIHSDPRASKNNTEYGYTLEAVLKQYPHFTKLTEYDKPRTIPINQEKWKDDQFFTNTSTPSNTSNSPSDSLSDSIRRTRSTIKDIVLCQEFNGFATFTFNSSEEYSKKYNYTIHDRANVDELKSVMGNWLHNQQKIHGSFAYLIVPEYHKDGKSIHFHALLKDYPGKLINSHKKINGRIAYNIASYRGGHSTLIKINPKPTDLEKVAHYVSKYITKDMPLFNQKKRYWCSKNLKRPTKTQNPLLTPHQRSTFHETYRLEEYGIRLLRSTTIAAPQNLASRDISRSAPPT